MRTLRLLIVPIILLTFAHPVFAAWPSIVMLYGSPLEGPIAVTITTPADTERYDPAFVVSTVLRNTTPTPVPDDLSGFQTRCWLAPANVEALRRLGVRGF